MYKILTIKDRVRVPPEKFGSKIDQSITESIKQKFEGRTVNDIFLVSLVGLKGIGDGIIIPGDGSIFYDSTFEILAYEPKLNEIIEGKVSEITEFGAFIEMGPIDGLSHLSQVMDDYVSYSKSGTLLGKKSKKTISVNDKVRARVIAVSLKASKGAKIGLTMRQGSLGKLEWLDKDKTKKVPKEKPEKAKKTAKGGKK